jgi:hypothetical protein
MDAPNGGSRQGLEDALAWLLAGRGPGIAVAPAGKQRFTVEVTCVTKDGRERVRASIPARGKGDRAALVEHGWELAVEGTGTRSYRNEFSDVAGATAGIVDAYAVAYGDPSSDDPADQRTWTVRSLMDSGSAQPSAAAEGGLGAYLLLLGFLVAGAAGVIAALAISLEPDPPSLPTALAAFAAAAVSLPVAFLGVVLLVDRLGMAGRPRLVQRVATGAPTAVGLSAATLAALLVLRLLPG